MQFNSILLSYQSQVGSPNSISNTRTQEHKNTTQEHNTRQTQTVKGSLNWLSYCWCCCITYIHSQLCFVHSKSVMLRIFIASYVSYIHSQLCVVLWYTPYKNQWIKLSILVLFKYDITEKVLEMQYNITIQWMDWIVCTFFFLALLDSFILSFYQL